jgi:hypothetical protein
LPCFGGGFFLITGPLDNGFRQHLRASGKQPPSKYLKNLYFDNLYIASRRSVFETNGRRGARQVARLSLRQIADGGGKIQTMNCTDGERTAMLHGNARKLLRSISRAQDADGLTLWLCRQSAPISSPGLKWPRTICIDGDDIYWIERRPQEGGRKVSFDIAGWKSCRYHARGFMRAPAYTSMAAATPRSMVELSSFHFADQQLYLQAARSEPKPLTASSLRYADGRIDRRRNLFYCVREDHSLSGEPVNTIVRVDLASGKSAIVVSGNDFYSSPRLSPDGSRFAWLTWNHPNMPWDGTEIWVGKLGDDGSIGKKKKSRVAPMNRSASQSGRPMARCISSRIARAGGIFTDGETILSNRSAQ